jgi:hypothetical protein
MLAAVFWVVGLRQMQLMLTQQQAAVRAAALCQCSCQCWWAGWARQTLDG